MIMRIISEEVRKNTRFRKAWIFKFLESKIPEKANFDVSGKLSMEIYLS